MTSDSIINRIQTSINYNKEWAEQVFSEQPDAELPFSFVYGGKSSTEIVGNWTRSVFEQELDSTKYQRVLTLTDPASGLEVKAIVTIYMDTPGVDWIIHIRNTSDIDTPVIEQVKAVDSVVSADNTNMPILHLMRGTGPGNAASTDDFLPLTHDLPRGMRIDIAPSDGRSSDGVAPFMNLQWDGGGVITAIGWTGQWCASIEHSISGKLCLQAGMEQMHLRLLPGETIRSPRILQLRWFGDDHLISYNLFRRTMFSHIIPKIDGKPVTPPIAHMATYFEEGMLQKNTESGVLSCIQPMEELGFEAVWIDACWMRRYGMGDYGFPIERVEDRVRFPHGLKPIGDAAHEAGMKFILWFAPEDVLPGTYLIDEHPDWIIFPGIQEEAPGRNEYGYGMLDLSIPEAREFMTAYLKAVIREYGMDCLRVDRGWFGGPLPCWRIKDGDDPDRIGISEIRAVEGLYKMWDDILVEFPHLFIDNCSGGGRRIDLETCARSIPLWATDYTTWAILPDKRTDDDYNKVSIQNQVMSAGLSRYLPMWSTGEMGVNPYWFRSAFTAGIPFCEDIRADDFPKAQLAAAIFEGKHIRKYFFGDFYPISPVTTHDGDWCVVQYYRPEDNDGMLFAFRRHESPDADYVCCLYEIDANAEYEVTYWYTFEEAESFMMPGEKLRDLELNISERPGSVLVEYRKIDR
ncbi:MAG: glycoside hydrolase family 36 protein [Armatimonadota bacterium]